MWDFFARQYNCGQHPTRGFERHLIPFGCLLNSVSYRRPGITAHQRLNAVRYRLILTGQVIKRCTAVTVPGRARRQRHCYVSSVIRPTSCRIAGIGKTINYFIRNSRSGAFAQLFSDLILKRFSSLLRRCTRLITGQRVILNNNLEVF
nr:MULTISPECIES: hypothetical protein [unclassified Pantoea]